ncbi:hypothetical protein SADUNF_Sadunf02G0085600 [Salix dunnii]|uniref:NAD(P)H-hydrate epimerase n=1 Tax=Salix dunnii TaxID=1413687 RepID=A0A835TGB4_9ROSI|nr:hypothetical protein SADUNF_Sadunf02G0085600 [Salix dunnii]
MAINFCFPKPQVSQPFSYINSPDREEIHKFCNMGSEAEILRKPRFLCLHGFRTSGEILKTQVHKWPESVLQKLDLVYLDAPFPSQGKSDVEGIFDPPYYEWFQFNKEFSEYTNFDECLAYIEDFMIKNGPFDGLLGFSQGVALTKVPKIKFLIIIGGAMFKSPSVAEKAYSSPVKCTSLHFLGKTDFLKEYGMELLKKCVDPVVIHHPKGHTIPRLVRSSPSIRSFSSKLGESNTTARMQNPESISHLTQREAAEVDEILMGPLGFSVDQLMELAGLSVASSIAEVYKPGEYSRVLAICGPGNNGGDGLVAARHLHHFGYKPFVCYPKRTQKPLYNGLVTQLESLSVPFLSVEDLPVDLSGDFDILVDAMFGFSFHGSPRPPFDDLIQKLVQLRNFAQNHPKSPVIVSVDIPSGWHVEEGDVSGEGVKPDMLVSLTAPKLCAKKFTGPHHFLGGRFVPPSIMDKFKLHLPPYPGTSMCVRIGKPPQIDISALRQNYISPELLEEQVVADPIEQFRKWFDDALAAGLREPNAMALSTVGKDGKPYVGSLFAIHC